MCCPPRWDIFRVHPIVKRAVSSGVKWFSLKYLHKLSNCILILLWRLLTYSKRPLASHHASACSYWTQPARGWFVVIECGETREGRQATINRFSQSQSQKCDRCACRPHITSYLHSTQERRTSSQRLVLHWHYHHILKATFESSVPLFHCWIQWLMRKST